MDKKCTAIVLAAGKGSRMGSKVHKQYLEVCGFPVLYYSLRAFEDSSIITDVVLVTGADEVEYCQREIVQKYHFSKVRTVVPGGKERYESVHKGLVAIRAEEIACDYVFIHDGARPFVDEEIIRRSYECVKEHRACVVGMPAKDTIKRVDDKLNAVETPPRNYLWIVQTPQVFEMQLICEAYDALIASGASNVTDDAMVVEQMKGLSVRLTEGSYENIKITTPEDLPIAETFIRRRGLV